MVRIAWFSVAAVVGLLLFVPATAHALAVYDDFESYTVMSEINGQGAWTSGDTIADDRSGWLVTNDHPTGTKYLRFWPSPWPGGFGPDSNFATWHAEADGQVAGLHLSIDYFIQTNGDCKVFLSGDNTSWIDVTPRLGLVKDDTGMIRQASSDLTDLIDDANIQSDIYVRFQAAASSGTAWVCGLDALALEITAGYRISGVVYEDTDSNYLCDGSDTPVANVEVWAVLDGKSVRDVASARSRMVGLTVRTASDGSFTLPPLPAGLVYDIVVSATGTDLTIRPGESALAADEGWAIPISDAHRLLWWSLLPKAANRGQLTYRIKSQFLESHSEWCIAIGRAFGTWQCALASLGVDVSFARTYDEKADVVIQSDSLGDPSTNGFAHTNRLQWSVGRAQIVLNDFSNAPGFAWTVEGSPAVKRYPWAESPPSYWAIGLLSPDTYLADVESRALHEVGHVLGLDHASRKGEHGETDFTVIMDWSAQIWPTLPPPLEWRHVLGWGDIEGLSAQIEALP